jgi:hypothetical protein
VPFALKDFRELCYRAYEVKPHRLLLGLIKQSTRGTWPTETQLRAANLLLVERALPASACMTRDRVAPRKATEATPSEVRALEVSAFDAMCAARPLKPPRVTRAEYAPVPSEVLKLRARDAHPDHDGFREAFLRDRR